MRVRNIQCALASSLLLWAVAVAPAPARGDGLKSALLLHRPDLHAHFWVSYALALTVTEVLEGPEPRWGPQLGTLWGTLIATGAVGALGVIKEVAVDDRLEGADLVADALGLGANGLVQWVIEF